MAFYPDIKDGMSPSALAQWLNSRGAFVKSYFIGERGPETKAMQAGTQIHRLIEAGLIKAKHVYEHAEDELSVTIAEGKVFRGRPDSWECNSEVASFVDYKSGKANGWKEKLPTDIKMRATAFLVWKTAHEPALVHGYIEFIQTTWNPATREVEPIDGKETEVEAIVYTHSEMMEFGKIIEREMDEVEHFYQKWLKSTGEFVSNADVERYAEIANTIVKLEAEADTLKESIQSQMEFGGEENHKTAYGTFYLTTKEQYDYPPALTFMVDGAEEYSLEEADRIAAGVKAAKKNFELANEPVSSKTVIVFKSKREK